jgi:apolipoprotein N-acyltransferase
MRLGNAICSEVTERDLVRDNAQGTNVFLSVGSNAMFANEMTSQFTLASAQFRAAENNLPVIRADRSGPSAFIDMRGAITSQMYSGQDGVLTRAMTFEKHPRATLYQLAGDWLLVGLCLSLLLLLVVI